ncbi:MAG: glycosyltransferase [Actinomycetales bacterium]|nr:glycosyltransferase [Actinomycetales bacterium]
MVLGAGAPPRTALWVVPVGEFGGVARHVLDAFSAAAQGSMPGWRLVLLAPPGPLVDRVRAAGGAVVDGPFGVGAGLRPSLATLRHTVSALQPAVVHSHLSWADIACAMAFPRAFSRGGVRLVSTEHGIAADDLVYHGTPWRAMLMGDVHRMRVARADALIAVSEATREAMLRKWRPRVPVRVIRNGIDRADAPGSTADPYAVDSPSSPAPARGPVLRIASIARLAPEKRIDRLIEAFALVHREHPEATLTIAGEGPLEGALRAQVSRLGLDAAVTFPGHVDAGELLRHTDVVAQLSVWENCSYTLLDALVAGTGVVATAVGGNPEILSPAALVAPEAPEQDPAAVAAALFSQGTTLGQRPTLDPTWPTVAQMCAAVADVYADLGGGADGQRR